MMKDLPEGTTRHCPLCEQTQRQADELLSLLKDGLAAADGAQTTMNAWAECGVAAGKDPCNSDNYCRLLDWRKAAEARLAYYAKKRLSL